MLEELNRRIVRCALCPRLVAWRQAAAENPPRRFRGQTYWRRPIPGFGDPRARLFIAGLAPAAHGGNRTGRVFTGDASGDFLFARLHESGFANQAVSVSTNDGLRLTDCYIGPAVRCAPPDNKPTPGEFDACRPYLREEIASLPELRAILALGALAFGAVLTSLKELGVAIPRPAPAFAHGASFAVDALVPGLRLVVLSSYHVSQQNTHTGRLTPEMFRDVLKEARRVLGAPRRPATR